MKRLLLIVFIYAALVLAGCAASGSGSDAWPRYESYKEIPGVTANEIEAIDRLLAEKPQLVYGVCESTEAFLREDGTVGGFAELFCRRMSELLGFQFEIYVCGWVEMNEKITSKEIDLVGDFTATPERQQRFCMTTSIVQRTLKVFTNIHTELEDIAKTRPVVCAFLNGSTTYARVAESWDMPFTPYFLDDQSDIPELLRNGEIDAFIEEGMLEAAFDAYDFIKTEFYYPLTYSPVSLTTGNNELAPIIDVMERYLQNGGFYELTELYNEGYNEYLKHKLYMFLTDEEKAYINSHNTPATAIKAACETNTYPASFYNTNEKEFQGIAIDILKGISNYTGLHIVPGNDESTPWPVLFEGLENGEYSIVTELMKTPQREGRFLWADVPCHIDNYALISKADYPAVDINQIIFQKIGLVLGAAYTDIFWDWFPDSTRTITYDSIDEAYDALESGEIDLLMGTQNLLLYLTNFLEKPAYKANIVFKYTTGSYFGFNKDEEILCSIVNKAMRYIDTQDITALWQRRIFDYRSKLMRQIVTYIIIVIVMLSMGFIAVYLLLRKNRAMNKNLGALVEARTGELALQTSTLTTIFESIPDLVFCKDMNMRFTRCNRSFEAYFGREEAEIVGKDDVEGLGMPPDVAAQHAGYAKHVIANGGVIVAEEYITGADGQKRLFETIRTPLMQNGASIGIMGISRDVTSRKAAEEEAMVASRAKSDFLSRMSHEIRTPLNAIIGMNSIALSATDIVKIRHCHERIDNASKHLLSLINDILDMSKIEAEKFVLSNAEFNFERMLMNISNVTNFRADEKNQNLVVNLDDGVPAFIISDELRLSQVITNLLTNAVKFTPERGSIVLSIKKESETAEDMVLRIEVADTGIGISDEQKKRLFTHFEQADGSISRRFGGTGLGLAISKRIVELMGGRIWIESELGHGSRFIFTISVKKGKENARALLADGINWGNVRILGVDDSAEAREYFAYVMSAHNLPFDIASSGDEAIEKVKNCGDRPYNIFFVDWQMPGMDGIELTKRIKSIMPDNSVVIMISVASWDSIEKEAVSAGVERFIPKPLFPSALINVINECLGAKPRSEKGSDGAKPGSKHAFDGHTILVAEDIDINREIISAILEDTGLTIDFAENGTAAVARFKQSGDRYSLVFMDIQMPEMDGFEATRAIRAIGTPESARVPIIAMTANVFREDVEACLAAGMNSHIGKPIDQEALFAKLEQYLGGEK